MTRGRRGSRRLRRMTLSFTAPRRCDRRTETTMTLLESLSTDLRRLHDVLDKSLDGLTTDQLHTVPAGHPKANTIAWNLWHYARTEDNVVRFVLQDRRFQAIVFAFGDRKSTRLNSSHVSISYAVFCLKKKTPE